MNATLNRLRRVEWPRFGLRKQAQQMASIPASEQDHAPGGYGRGVYAGHATYDLDFHTQGSYGRGVYAGRSTIESDFDTPGSYGRGVYAGRSTASLGFGRQGSFASGA